MTQKPLDQYCDDCNKKTLVQTDVGMPYEVKKKNGSKEMWVNHVVRCTSCYRTRTGSHKVEDK